MKILSIEEFNNMLSKHKKGEESLIVVNREIRDLDLHDKDIRRIQVISSDMSETNFRNVNARRRASEQNGINFSETYLQNCIFNNADLSGANLTKAYFGGSTFTDAVMIGANCMDANFDDADMQRVNLKYANLRKANIFDVNLKDSNLIDVDLSESVLKNADLRGANLKNTNLIGADLDGALIDTNIFDAVLGIKEIRYLTQLSQEDFSRKYYFNEEELKKWETKEIECPIYVINLLKRVVKEDYYK